MNPDQLKERSSTCTPEYTIDYWIRSSTAGGRIRLQLRLQTKLWAWKSVIFLAHGIKRLFDILISALAILLASPLFFVTALLIKLEDGGPVFFKQTRVGYRGKLFTLWKFRSMVINADEAKKSLQAQNEMSGGILFKMKNDPRVSRIGKFIRRFSIDELPQLWNVLLGNMALVGPRPSLPIEVAEYSPEDRQRLLVKPGITCLWQVSGRSQIDFAGQVKLDLAYIRSSSLWTDLKLLAMTIPAVLTGKGAY